MRKPQDELQGLWRFLGLVLLAFMSVTNPWGARVSFADDDDHHEAKLYGTIEALPGTPGYVGDWMVSGKAVHVSAATRIEQEHGLVALGAYVEVEGSYRADGSMDAWKIEVKSAGGGGSGSAKFYGVIESLPASGFVGDWMVSGKAVHVSAATQVNQEHGLVALGAYVEVEGRFEADGSLTAFKVEVKSSSSTGGIGSAVTRFAVLRLVPGATPLPAQEGKVAIKQFIVDSALVREDLKASIEHLLARTTYDVYVDGIHAGAILTNDEGEGKLFLSTAPLSDAEPLPAELSPLDQRQRVDVKLGQDVVLTGNFAAAAWGGSGSPQPTQVGAAALTNPEGAVVGAAVVKAEVSEQELKLMGFGLWSQSNVQVVVDGVLLATVRTNAQGELRATFSSRPEHEELLLPDALLPVTSWTQLELRSENGQLLGSGHFVLPAAPERSQAEGTARRHLGRGRP